MSETPASETPASDTSASDTPESDYTDVSVPDEDLPDDLQPGEDNPLAESAGDDADRQDMGDPHIEGLQRDGDALTMPTADDEDPSGES